MSNILEHLITKNILPQDAPANILTIDGNQLTFHAPIQHLLDDIQKEFLGYTIKQDITSPLD